MPRRPLQYILTPKVSYSFVVSTSADGLPIPDLRLPPPPCAKCSNGSPPKNMTLVSYLCNTYERCAMELYGWRQMQRAGNDDVAFAEIVWSEILA